MARQAAAWTPPQAAAIYVQSAIRVHAAAAVTSPTPRIPNMIRSAFGEIVAGHLRPFQ